MSTKHEGKQQNTVGAEGVGSVNDGARSNTTASNPVGQEHTPVALNLSKTAEAQHHKTTSENNINSNNRISKEHPTSSQGLKNSEKHAVPSATVQFLYTTR